MLCVVCMEPPMPGIDLTSLSSSRRCLHVCLTDALLKHVVIGVVVPTTIPEGLPDVLAAVTAVILVDVTVVTRTAALVTCWRPLIAPVVSKMGTTQGHQHSVDGTARHFWHRGRQRSPPHVRSNNFETTGLYDIVSKRKRPRTLCHAGIHELLQCTGHRHHASTFAETTLLVQRERERKTVFSHTDKSGVRSGVSFSLLPLTPARRTMDQVTSRNWPTADIH